MATRSRSATGPASSSRTIRMSETPVSCSPPATAVWIWRRSAILWQQRGVQVERAVPWHGDEFFTQDMAVRHDERNIGRERRESLRHVGGHPLRLVHRQTVIERPRLDGVGLNLLPAPDRPVGLREDRDDFSPPPGPRPPASRGSGSAMGSDPRKTRRSGMVGSPAIFATNERRGQARCIAAVYDRRGRPRGESAVIDRRYRAGSSAGVHWPCNEPSGNAEVLSRRWFHRWDDRGGLAPRRTAGIVLGPRPHPSVCRSVSK